MGRFKKDLRGMPILPVGYSKLPAVERREMMDQFIEDTVETFNGKIVGAMATEIISDKMALNAEGRYYWEKDKSTGLWLIDDGSDD